MPNDLQVSVSLSFCSEAFQQIVLKYLMDRSFALIPKITMNDTQP